MIRDETYELVDAGVAGCRIFGKYNTGLFDMQVERAFFPPSQIEWAEELVKRMNAPVWTTSPTYVNHAKGVFAVDLMRHGVVVAAVEGTTVQKAEENAEFMAKIAEKNAHLYTVGM